VISRADMAAREVPKTTVNGWYRERVRQPLRDPRQPALALLSRARRLRDDDQPDLPGDG
jgi:hypothetical protein